MRFIQRTFAKQFLLLVVTLPQAQAGIAQDTSSQIIPMVCRGEIWVRDGQVDNKRLVQHSYITIEVTLDKTKGILGVKSPVSIYGVHGGDQILVKETPAKYYFITNRDRQISEEKGIRSVSTAFNFNSTLDRNNGEIVLMEGAILYDGMGSSFAGECERAVQRF